MITNTETEADTAADAVVDADRIAAAVQACPHVAGLHGGRFGEIATYLPGRRVTGVRVRPEEITIGVVGIYPATIARIGADVAISAAVADRRVHVRILDLAPPHTAPDEWNQGDNP